MPTGGKGKGSAAVDCVGTINIASNLPLVPGSSVLLDSLRAGSNKASVLDLAAKKRKNDVTIAYAKVVKATWELQAALEHHGLYSESAVKCMGEPEEEPIDVAKPVRAVTKPTAIAPDQPTPTALLKVPSKEASKLEWLVWFWWLWKQLPMVVQHMSATVFILGLLAPQLTLHASCVWLRSTATGLWYEIFATVVGVAEAPLTAAVQAFQVEVPPETVHSAATMISSSSLSVLIWKFLARAHPPY